MSSYVLSRPELLERISNHLSPNNVDALRYSSRGLRASMSNQRLRPVEALVARIRLLRSAETRRGTIYNRVYLIGKTDPGTALWSFQASDVFLDLQEHSFGDASPYDVPNGTLTPDKLRYIAQDSMHWADTEAVTVALYTFLGRAGHVYNTQKLLPTANRSRLFRSNLGRERMVMSALAKLVMTRPDLTWSLVGRPGNGAPDDVFTGSNFDYVPQKWQAPIVR